MSKDDTRKRVGVRLYDDEYEKLVYWAKKYDVTQNEFMIRALNHYVGFINSDYDLPTAEQQRLKQLIDAIESLTVAQTRFQKSHESSMSSLLNIAQGKNPLSDHKDDGRI